MLAEILYKMGGIIEFYKIDKSKTRENLLSILSDLYLSPRETNLKYVSSNPNEYTLSNFKNWIELKNSETKSFKISYEHLIEKIYNEFFQIDNNEFQIMLDWLTWYYENEFGNDPKFLEDLGLIEIGDLNSKHESIIFHVFGEFGLNDFDENLNIINNPNQSLHVPYESQKMKLAINFLIILSYRITLKNDNDFLIDEKSQKTIHKLSKNKRLNHILEKFSKYNSEADLIKTYGDDFKYLYECSEHYLYKMLSIKKEIANYSGLIYRVDHY